MAKGQVCETEGCEKPAKTRGLCWNCYMRWYSAQGSDLPCSVEGCDRRSYGRSGLCPMHYQRRRILGDVGEAAPRFMQGATVAERFWAKVDKDGPVPSRSDLGPCWRWTAGHFSSSGYGALGVNGTLRGAHVVAYELVKGPIPEGLELDHLCHTTDPSCSGGRDCIHRGCCNPDHLEPVTHRENSRRGRRATVLATGRCKHGHDMTDPANQKPGSKGRVNCRICANRARMERYWRLGR